MSVKTAFQILTTRQRGLAALGVAAACLLAGAATVSHVKSSGALEGISQRLRQSNADRIPDARLMIGQMAFRNTVTGAAGRFELMSRTRQPDGMACYEIAITDGDYSGASTTITDKGGRVHKVAMAARVCL